MVVAGAFVRLLRLAAVMADATDGQPATDFATTLDRLADRLRGLASQQALTTRVVMKRVPAVDFNSNLQALNERLQWSIFRKANGEMVFSTAEPVVLIDGVTTLCLLSAVDQLAPSTIQMRHTVEGGAEEFTGFASGVVWTPGRSQQPSSVRDVPSLFQPQEGTLEGGSDGRRDGRPASHRFCEPTHRPPAGRSATRFR